MVLLHPTRAHYLPSKIQFYANTKPQTIRAIQRIQANASVKAIELLEIRITNQIIRQTSSFTQTIQSKSVILHNCLYLQCMWILAPCFDDVVL